MTPKKLILKNFLSHEDTTIDFTNLDAVCLYGSNGSGKTSVIDAMLFALYGQTSKGSDDSLIQLGKDNMYVEFIFDVNGIEYKITKSKNRGQTKQSNLYKNNELIATGNKTDEFIQELFGMNYNTFTSTYFLLQDNAYKFILATPAERYKILFDILNLNIYQEYKKIVSQYKKDSENKIKFYQQNIDDRQSKINETENFKDELDFYQIKFNEIQEEIRNTEQIYIQKEKLLTDFINKKNEYEKLLLQIKNIDNQINSSLQAINKSKEILKFKNQIENAQAKKQELEQQNQKLFEREKGLIEMYELEKKQYTDIINQEQFYIREIEKLDGNINAFTIEINNKQKNINEYFKLVELLNRIPCGGKGEYSNCELIQNALQAKQQLPEIISQKEITERQVNELLQTKEKFENDLKELQKTKSTVIERNQILSENIKNVQQQKEKILKEISNVNKILEYLPQIIQAEKIVELEQKNIDNLKLQKTDIENQIKIIQQDIEQFQNVESEINQLKQSLLQLKDKEQTVQNKIIELKTQIAQKEQIEKEINNLKSMIETEKQNLTIYMLLEDAYDKIPKIMFNNYISIIESVANDVLDKIAPNNMQVELITEKTTKTTKITKNTIEISVSDIMGERKIESFSGGEKTRLTLAFTVALSELASSHSSIKIKTLVIDEPPGLDSQGFKDFALCIKQLINTGIFNTCIVISHSGDLIEEFNNKIKFEKLKSGVSKCYIEKTDNNYNEIKLSNLDFNVKSIKHKSSKKQTRTQSLFV